MTAVGHRREGIIGDPRRADPIEDRERRDAGTGARRGYPPIADYALLGDCHSAALVARDGSIDWCVFHRFDASPVFARLLDRARGGCFRIAPTGPATTRRRYRPGTLVLETRFETDTGTAVLVDCLPVREADGRDEAVHPYHQLIRRVVVEEGEVELAVELSPRFDYGLTVPRMEVHADGSALVYAGADALFVDSDLSLEQTELCGCHARARLRAGQDAFVVLTHHLPHELREERLEPEEMRRRIESTERFWRDWSDRCEYEGTYRDALVRSALTLKSLTNAPTGAIVAAPTTSLPEWIGGTRNWDYRYSWLRDAALNLYALFTLGYG